MDYEIQNAASNNFASVLYSTDGTTFTYLKRWWAPVGGTCSFVGEQKVMLPQNAISSTLYFAFIFQGDYSGSMTVDDIDIWNIGSKYKSDADSYAYCYVDVSDFDSVTMSFDYWADVEAGWDWFSPAYYVGSSWFIPSSMGSTAGWVHSTLSIPIDATRIGFYFHSDSSVVMHGVYVDNVQLVGLLNTMSPIEVFRDGLFQGIATGGGTWNYTLDTTKVSDGPHNISASAVFGSSTISDTETTFVDNTAPLLTSITKVYQRGNNITIIGYANTLGGSWLQSLVFSSGAVSGYFQNPLQGIMLNASTILWMLANSTRIPDGHYEFNMTLADYVGNQHTISFVFNVDNCIPVMSRPPDIAYVAGTAGHMISWTCTDLNPDCYQLYRDGVLILSGSWTSGLEYSVDGLAVGSYSYTVMFYDCAGNFVTDTVLVTVSSSTGSNTGTTSTNSTTGTSTATSTGELTTTPMSLIVVIAVAAGLAVVVVVVLIQIKHKR
jgi:hypothetical protein